MKPTNNLTIKVMVEYTIKDAFSLDDLCDSGKSIDELTMELIEEEGLYGISEPDPRILNISIGYADDN